jgi:Ca-activated chloride channel family protein
MSWGNPWILLVLAFPLLGAIGLRRMLRQPARPQWPAMKRVAVSAHRVRPAAPPRMRPAFLIMVALALTIIALARPRWGEHSEQSYSHTREVMIALDLSRSMLTEDVTPSRLEHAKKLTEDLLTSLKGESVGLIVFAGTAFVQVPLSPDYQIIREFMPSLDPDYMPQGGSDYAAMLDAALDGFSDTPDRDRYLIVLSDGESSTESWSTRLDRLSEREIHVVAIGVGTDEGGFVADPYEGGYMADENGDAVHSKLMRATLQSLARRTNGRYVDGTTLTEIDDVRALLEDTVETGRKGRVSTETTSARTERFQWFLLPAVLIGLFSLAREFRQRPRPRRVRREPPDAPAQADSPEIPTRQAQEPSSLAAGIALAVGVLAGTAFTPAARAHFDSEADFEVRQVFDSNPVERLRAITEHLAEFDYDAFDLRLMVEESIRYGQDAQRTGTAVSQGVIRDAIDATHQGERLDSSIADWGYYRAQLAALLEPPADAAAREESQARKQLLDEEDNPPMVAGESSQSFANDSFGQGASAKTDAMLGDLSPAEENLNIPRGKKPEPPRQVRTAATRSRSDGGGGDSEDPILALTRKRLEEAARRDSPGRLHQLMADGTQHQETNKFDW